MNAEQRAAVDNIIAQKAQQYSVNIHLIRAVIQQESNWDVNARLWEPSKNEASAGLMQVLPSTANWILGTTLTEAQLYDPNTNIDAGVKYLSYLQGRYGQAGMDDVIAAYNAGSPRFTQAGAFVNQSYVDKVLQYMTMYESLGAGAQYAASAYSKLTGGPESGSADVPIVLVALSAGILLFDIFKYTRKRKVA